MLHDELHRSLISWNIEGSRKRATTQPPLRYSKSIYNTDILPAQLSVDDNPDSPRGYCDVYSPNNDVSMRTVDLVPSQELDRTAFQRTTSHETTRTSMLRRSSETFPRTYSCITPDSSLGRDMSRTHLCDSSVLEPPPKAQKTLPTLTIHLKDVSFTPFTSQDTSNTLVYHRKDENSPHTQSLLLRRKTGVFQAKSVETSPAPEDQGYSPTVGRLSRHHIDFYVALPRVLNAYLYFFLQFCVILIFVLFIFRFALALRRDLGNRILYQRKELVARVETCKDNYIQNRCQPETRVPALTQLCTEWETCMNALDVGIFREAATGAEILGSVIHSFFEQFSYKTIFLMGICSTATVLGSYFVCWSFRKLCFSSCQGSFQKKSRYYSRTLPPRKRYCLDQ